MVTEKESPSYQHSTLRCIFFKQGGLAMKKSEIFWQTYLNLERELLELSRYVYITDHTLINTASGVKEENCSSQLETFSPYIADLLIRTCIEIEALSKELYFELGGEKLRGDPHLFFDEDCLKLIDIKCKTSKKVIIVSCSSFALTNEQNYVLKPLREAHKRQGTDWERAYQAVKHDRYTSVSMGTIKNFIHALAALYLLNIYFRNDRLYTRYLDMNKMDMSMGSKVFSLKRPTQQHIIDAVNCKEIVGNLDSQDSPYVMKYRDDIYQQIIKAEKQSRENRLKYLESQPEYREVAFIEQLRQAAERAKKNPKQRLIPLWELAVYRINKKIPRDLPFEERKKLFVNSSEFNSQIHQSNLHKTESELTEENIQSEINSAGIRAGMALDGQFDREKEQKAFVEGFCELVIDKGDVHYRE